MISNKVFNKRKASRKTPNRFCCCVNSIPELINTTYHEKIWCSLFNILQKTTGFFLIIKIQVICTSMIYVQLICKILKTAGGLFLQKRFPFGSSPHIHHFNNRIFLPKTQLKMVLIILNFNNTLRMSTLKKI